MLALLSFFLISLSQFLEFWDLATFIYKNQPLFSNDAWFGKSRKDLFDLLGGWAQSYGVSNSTFYSGLF